MKEFHIQTSYSVNNSEQFHDQLQYNRQRITAREKLRRTLQKAAIVGAAILCLELLIGASVAGFVLFGKNLQPPDLICTYSGKVSTKYTVKPTMKAYLYNSEIHSREGSTIGEYLHITTYFKQDFKSTSLQQGRMLTTVRPFFNRSMCHIYNGQSTCQRITKGVQKASWHAPCPSQPNVICDIYTGETSSSSSLYNETWYLFPESMFPNLTKRVPSGYYVETDQYSSFNVFEELSFEDPPDSVFQLDFSGYCYDVENEVNDLNMSAKMNTTAEPNMYYEVDKITSMFKPTDMNHIKEYQNWNFYQGLQVGVSSQNQPKLFTKFTQQSITNTTTTTTTTSFYQRRYNNNNNNDTNNNNNNNNNNKGNDNDENLFGIPMEFDSRSTWRTCGTISSIRDQGDCGACWSFSAVEVLADRFCIEGNVAPTLSAQYMVNCFGESGCMGGYADVAWERLITNGTVSEKCSEYKEEVEVCSNECVSNPSEPFRLYKAKSGYSIYVDGNFEETARLIQLEILDKGPVGASLFVYSDFYDYKEGVYSHKASATPVGMHSVKIIGWGEDEKTGNPYWLAANTWGKRWGLNGFFKILRGFNECGIEYMISTGDPLIT